VVVKKLTSKYGSTTIGYLFILAGAVYCLYSSTSWYLQRREHLKALASGHFDIAQGVVQDFHPMPDDGSSKESFTISGNTFSYSDFDELEIDTCFNQTTRHDGPIHGGISLRVSFTDGCILRIQEAPNDSGKLEH
jgi:hypothetical protein